MRSKPTAGERIMMTPSLMCWWAGGTLEKFRTDQFSEGSRKYAKAIGRAIRKAAKDAATAERARIAKVLSDYADVGRRNPDSERNVTLAALARIAADAVSTKPATVRGRKGKK